MARATCAKKITSKLFTVLAKSAYNWPGRAESVDALPSRLGKRVLAWVKSGTDAALTAAAEAWYGHFFAPCKMRVSTFVCRHFLGPAIAAGSSTSTSSSSKSLDAFLGADFLGSEAVLKQLKEVGNEEATAALFAEPEPAQGLFAFAGFSDKFVPGIARLLKRQPELADGLFSAVAAAVYRKMSAVKQLKDVKFPEADSKALLAEGFDLLKTTSTAKRAIGERVVEAVTKLTASS